MIETIESQFRQIRPSGKRKSKRNKMPLSRHRLSYNDNGDQTEIWNWLIRSLSGELSTLRVRRRPWFRRLATRRVDVVLTLGVRPPRYRKVPLKQNKNTELKRNVENHVGRQRSEVIKAWAVTILDSKRSLTQGRNLSAADNFLNCLIIDNYQLLR